MSGQRAHSRPVTGSELKGGPKPPKNDKQPSGSSLPVSDSELRGGPNIPRDDKQPTGPSRPVTNPRGTFSVPGWFSSPSSAGAPSSAEKGPAPASSTPGPSILKKPSSAGTPSGSAAKPHADPSSTPGPSILKKPSSTAATSTPNDDISPVSRARNKAEVFKPKTPSRLRETTPSVRESLVRSATQMNESFPNAEWVDTSAQDWLVEICPNGNFKKLPWPEPDEVGEDEAAAQSWVNLAVKKDETITQAAISQWQAMMTATS
ncbi:hypothetical protein N7470_002397 [Penicillium chermesinum]|nr:hypothetical protein N7470_002397 [Penicillium chermesinum]